MNCFKIHILLLKFLYSCYLGVESYLVFASEHSIRGIPLSASTPSNAYYTDAMTPIVGTTSIFS